MTDVLQVLTTCGYRYHRIDGLAECWCIPDVEPLPCDGCGGVHYLRTHKDVTLTRDRQPRMTVFSR